ncbi:AsnC family transcriptional regulator [Haladaptatus pallidirubidus]|uniref:HTH asnC-type domain-containing protein n=1 Tax=Haladaptatus pallidirubidus TaxID=1008152 RepID=A0AAV3UGT3_9EURY|nr:AsnC family transcriptional regulator [Haladaptatus pallidirubidus]
MTTSKFENWDEIDSEILRLLAADPRAPYSEIADHLEAAGYEMSSEGIRYRVSKLLDATTVFFLLDPEDVSWEIVRIAVKAVDESEAKTKTFEKIADMRFWHVTRGIGTYDVYAVGMAPTLAKVDELVTTIEEYEFVENVEHIVVTERESAMSDYYLSEDAPTD